MSKNENEKAQIVLDNADKFANELWSKIVDDRLFSYQKNDICDYLLYLFNTHSKDKFLDTNLNEQNERLLKMSATKIKTSKKNIAVKFMDNKQYNQIFKDFLTSLATTKSVKEKENGNLEFIIENNVLKDILEAKLKKWVNETFTYTLNSEKLSISCEAFLTMIKREVEEQGKEKECEQAIKSLERTYTLSNLKTLAKKGIKFVRDFAPLVATLL